LVAEAPPWLPLRIEECYGYFGRCWSIEVFLISEDLRLALVYVMAPPLDSLNGEYN